MTSEPLDAKLLAAQRDVMRLVEDGAPDRVVEAGRSLCKSYRMGLPPCEQDLFTIQQHSARRQQQDRYGR